ncbi:MAG: hypothetical protein JJT88_12445 [Gammaproteobacteria bacterium]|nr:hypothetical protein [Gammaproteobacteria bacterium]
MVLRLKLLAAAMLVIATWATSPPASADLIEMSALGDYCGGEDTGAVCRELGARYDVAGGGVVNPAASVDDTFLTPGSDTGDATQVRSFNVTTTADQPPNGTEPIFVSNLEGAFDFYWGSVDAFNQVELLFGETVVQTFTGQDVADLVNATQGTDYSASDEGNFDFDQYIAFTATGERLGFFDAARLSVTSEGSDTGVAFEVATTAVPEPPLVALLGAGLLAFGLIRLRRRGA